MKILVYGAGVQGSFLAHVLDDGGHDVEILARGNRAEQLRENGIVIRHYFQRKTTVNKIKVIEELKGNDFYDIIFVTMKYNDFEKVLPILAQNISENIVLVGNNVSALEMQEYIETHSANKKNLVFGFQVTGGKRTEEHVVAIRFDGGEMKVGSLNGDVPIKLILEKAFEPTKYKITFENNIDAWLMNHAAMIPGMNFAIYIKGNDAKAVARDKELLKEAVYSMGECFDVLENLGYEMNPKKLALFVRKHKYAVYWFLKLYHSLPMANDVVGDIGEIKKICQVINQMKVGTDLQTPNLDRLMQKADYKNII